MKAVLLALVVASAGAAGVAGLSFGLPDGLSKGLPRLGAGSGGAASVSADEASGASGQTRFEMVQADTGATSAVETSQRRVVVDESALRYFAARGDTARLNAEIARLRALYPTWTPPENPLAVPVNEDRQLEEMWALYSQARYADVRAAIERRRTEDPQWTPPAVEGSGASAAGSLFLAAAGDDVLGRDGPLVPFA